MIKSLWIKFLILLFSVSLVCLSAAFFLRGMIIKDFEEYLEGETEDRVYRVMAATEGTYEKHAGWNREALKEDAVWALLLGYDVRVLDEEDNEITNTGKAVEALSPLMKKRITAITGFSAGDNQSGKEPFISYPLYLAGSNIGSLEVRPVTPRGELRKQTVFMVRSNRFLILSLFFVGGLSLLVSFVFSKRLTDPIKKLTLAAEDISEGNISSRVKVSSGDEIGNLARAFNSMAGALQLQESLRRKLNANIAHELRTPLSAIQGELEGMIDGLIHTDRERLLSLHEETTRLKTIIEGFEELARAEASVLSLKKQTIHLAAFLKHIKERFDKVFSDKGVLLLLECDDAVMSGDPDKISQIVINLLSNALKATGKGGKVIMTGLSSTDMSYVVVKDTGKGIKAEELPYIFERFYKASEGGLGIGLAIAKELAEAHGGGIKVESREGEGSTFTLYVPNS